MLASGWRLTGTFLTEIVDAGYGHEQVKATLRKDAQFRAQYLVLYDLVNTIVNVNQQKFAVFATTARMSLPPVQSMCTQYLRPWHGSALEHIFQSELVQTGR